MFEQLIPMLEEQGVDFREDYDAGILDINVEALDKAVLINVIGAINDMGLTFTINETSLTVNGGEMLEEPIMEEEPAGDAEAMALEEMLSGGGM
jgi:hypothetical protein